MSHSAQPSSNRAAVEQHARSHARARVNPEMLVCNFTLWIDNDDNDEPTKKVSRRHTRVCILLRFVVSLCVQCQWPNNSKRTRAHNYIYIYTDPHIPKTQWKSHPRHILHVYTAGSMLGSAASLFSHYRYYYFICTCIVCIQNDHPVVVVYVRVVVIARLFICVSVCIYYAIYAVCVSVCIWLYVILLHCKRRVIRETCSIHGSCNNEVVCTGKCVRITIFANK